MTTNYFTPIPTGADNRSSNWNSVNRDLDDAVRFAGGGINATDNYLLAHYLNASQLQVFGIVYDETYPSIIDSYNFSWADGSDGQYKTLEVDPNFLEVIDWIVIHRQSLKILRFFGIERDINGNIVTPGQFVVYNPDAQLPVGGCIDSYTVLTGQTVFGISPVCVSGTLTVQTGGTLIVF